MNKSFVFKSAAALTATGATIGGGLAWMYWPTSKAEAEPREITSEEWEVIKGNRVASLEKIYLKYATTQEAREELAEIINGDKKKHVIFYIRENAKNFEDPGYVGTEIGAWCNRPETSPLISKYPDFKKEEICKVN